MPLPISRSRLRYVVSVTDPIFTRASRPAPISSYSYVPLLHPFRVEQAKRFVTVAIRGRVYAERFVIVLNHRRWNCRLALLAEAQG